MDKQKYMLYSERKKLADEYEEWVKKPLEDGSKIKDCPLSVITFMSIKGFCKIPENAVVLTGSETTERLEDLLIDFDEMGFYPAITCPNPDEYAREWKSKLIYAIGQLQKETVDEIKNKAHKTLTPYTQSHTLYSESEKAAIKACLNKFDEICQEITEKKDG